MPRKSKAIIGVILAAIAIVALMAAPAFANTVTVNLAVDRATQTYGNDVNIIPTVVGTDTIPGDAITLQAWDSVESTWTLFGEGIKVEDTGTVVPQSINVDESLLPWYVLNTWQPIQFRAQLKTVSRGKDASGSPLPTVTTDWSNTVSFTVAKVRTTKVKTAFPKKVKRNAKVWLHADVTTPAFGVGIGTMKFGITGPGKGSTVTAQTDETGAAVIVGKFTKRGTYKVFTTFMGNAFGAKSKTVMTKITVR
jgi:hypothetical protein